MPPKETATQRKRRLAAKKQKKSAKRIRQSAEQIEEAKKQKNESQRRQRCSQTLERREQILARRREQWASQPAEQREQILARWRDQWASQPAEQREQILARWRDQWASQPAEQREQILARWREQWTSQPAEQREQILARWREQWASQPAEQRQEALALRQEKRAAQMMVETFNNSINKFCTSVCKICTKSCYENQVTMVRPNDAASTYLPPELCGQSTLLLCSRCRTHVTSMKRTAPPKAYWNNLDPGAIPSCIQNLTEPEQRLLARIIPFVKIIKFSGRFGQFGFKGQAVLFAQDLYEVTEKLPTMLPRSPSDAGMIVVTEHLENLDVTREYTISRERVYDALRWLIEHNPLYKDVVVDSNVVMDGSSIVRVDEATPVAVVEPQLNVDNPYKPISDQARILHASWHQGNVSVFSEYAGVQCCAISLANIIRASFHCPNIWDQVTLNENLIAGDTTYSLIREKTPPEAIDVTGYLEVTNFDVIRNSIVMYGKTFTIDYDADTRYYGSLLDSANRGGFGMTLRAALQEMFREHNAGILIANSKAVAVVRSGDLYYLADSHSCGPKGMSARGDNGRACVIQCETLDELHRVYKRNNRNNTQFTLNYIKVTSVSEPIERDATVPIDVTVPLTNTTSVSEPIERDVTVPLTTTPNSPDTRPPEPIERDVTVPLTTTPNSPDTRPPSNPDINPVASGYLPVQTCMMGPIDIVQPDVGDELEVADDLNSIRRKTTNNIVNEAHELKAEEFAWFQLFPYGVNGYKEERPQRITALDYYQYRILGSDKRFQRNDYLFYALSMFEYYKVKATIAACGKKIKNRDGDKIEDVHLYLRTMRGSAAYWRTALRDLIAQIRCLGPPTYFVTFSCNDLNWIDMRKALLIADGRPEHDPLQLTINEVQKLVETYPVTVSRHFMVRLNALMRYLKHNDEVLGGHVKDHWWRIEFQNRGSPHLHMLVWIENSPSMETEEGLALIDKICVCKLPPEGTELHELVKKCQRHSHTHTCYKNDNSSTTNPPRCRFNFPRPTAAATHIIDPSSDDFLRTGGRICILQRNESERWINTYNPTLLQLWQGNMDIQPCGSNESIAYYIAKYVAKSEPTNLDGSVAQAIQLIRREENDVSKRLFKICMRLMKERQISACESVYRLGHLPMKDSSRKTTFLNTRKPEERFNVIKFNDQGQAIGYCANVHERYMKRPLEYESMSLLEFAMTFDPYYAKPAAFDEENVDEDAYESAPITRTRRQLVTLLDNSKVVKRTTLAVVSVPHFVAANDPEHYYYSLLAQYMPFRREEELLDGFNSAQEAFCANEDRLKEVSAHMEVHRQRDRELQLAFDQVHAFQILEEEPPEYCEDIEDVPEPVGMDRLQFENAQRAMNSGQREIFVMVTESIRKQLDGSAERLRIFFTGGAGVGKTFLLNLLREQIDRCYTKKAVRVSAYTGVAARLAGGSTLHSALRLPVQKDGRITGMPALTGNYLQVMRQQWKDVEFFIIDEISMVSYQVLTMIDARLRQIKNNEETFFGGLNVLLFGDLMQLPPIKMSGTPVYKQPQHMQPATHLWRLFTLCELTQNMRQHGDNTFVDLLNALRVGQMRSEHFAVLALKAQQDHTEEFALEKALRIYPTTKQVEDHNQSVLDLFKRRHVSTVTIIAQDRLVDASRPLRNVKLEDIIPADINKTGGLPRELEIFEGAKVMLRSNVDVSKGLVNGAIGFVQEIIWPHFRRAQMYAKDIPAVRVDFGRDGSHVVHPKAIQFPAKFSYGTAERRMLPFILSWASTVHKMQGSTVDHAVVYLGPKLFEQGQAYVALSRVRSLDGLRIEQLDCSKLTGKKPVNNDALDELDRMRRSNRTDTDSSP